MRIVVLGAGGIIGQVIVRDLLDYGGVEQIVAADVDLAAAQATAQAAGGSVQAAQVDVTDHAALVALLRGAGACINSVNYYFNLQVMRACLEAGAHYVDLGGLFHTTRKQLELHGAFEQAGLTAVLGLGSCPGIANVHAGYLGGLLDTVEAIRIYNGATPDVGDSLAPAYTLHTIFDEIIKPAMVFREGEFRAVAPVSEEEDYPFREPIGYARTHLSLHSEVATIPLVFKDKGLRECFFKITAFGYSQRAFDQLRLLASLGLMDDQPMEVAGEVDGGKKAVRVRPRDVLMRALASAPASEPQGSVGFKDIATEALGVKDGQPVRYRLDTTAWPKEQWSASGGKWLVASPPAIIARWLGDGKVAHKGVHPPEVAVEPLPFLRELERRGAKNELTRIEPL